MFGAILDGLGGSYFAAAVGWVIGGALAGIIGGAVMLWTFTRRRGIERLDAGNHLLSLVQLRCNLA